MFGPTEHLIYGHHRSTDFIKFLRDLERLFLETFDLGDDWVVVFVPGSGTTANEIVLTSLDCQIMGEGIFTDRLRDLQRIMPIWTMLPLPDDSGGKRQLYGAVGYETAASNPTGMSLIGKGSSCFLDLVSAFPYYNVPDNCAVWTTVPCKQLGSKPGFGIVVMRKWLADYIEEKDDRPDSVLCLGSYLRWRRRGMLPHTPPIFALESLRNNLLGFSLHAMRMRTDHRRIELETVVPEEHRIGEGPVFTFREDSLPALLLRKWRLYIGALGPQAYLHHHGPWSDFVVDLACVDWGGVS